MLLTFRPATGADVPEIVALVERAYRGEPSRAGWTTEADLLGGQRTDADQVRELVVGDGHRVLLACEADRVVACVRLSEEDGGAYVGMFAVDPVRQASGIGRRLLEEAERVAREDLGAPTLRMTVLAQRPELIAWYQRRGFARTGAREAFPYGDPRFGEPRRDDLYFVELSKAL